MNIPGTFFHQLFNDPLIVVISSGYLLNSGIIYTLNIAKGELCYIIVQPAWHIVPRDIKALLDTIHAAKKVNSNAHFIFICPTNEETNLLNTHEIQAHHIHKCAFIDDQIFTPVLRSKIYSAIHIANVEKFKRHNLAYNIPNIAVVSYGFTEDTDAAELQGYQDLAYGNFNITNGKCILGKKLSSQEVRDIINASTCGLILSAIEGANNASVEYALCGIPFITTPSLGGRDELYDTRFVFIVEPEEKSVLIAVEKLQNNLFDPFEIRESVMTKIRVHRRRFIDLLSSLTNQNLTIQANKDFWIPQFTDKLRSFIRLENP